MLRAIALLTSIVLLATADEAPNAAAKLPPDIRSLRFSDVNFLHTTDTHGWLAGHHNQHTYNADWGDFVAFVEHLRNTTAANGQDLLVVDSGDRHDGNGLSDITTPNGARSLPVFMRQHYDVVTLGNHELYLWESVQQEVELLMPHYKNSYVCSNVEFERDGKWFAFGQKYRYFTTRVQKRRVLAFAFLFDFDRAAAGTRVTPIRDAIKQEWFASALAHYPPSEVDMVLVVGHVPVAKLWPELGLLHAALRSHYPDAKIQYFGGHSHIRDFSVFDGLSTGLQSGRFCETVGFLSVNMDELRLGLRERYFRSYIDFSTRLFVHHSAARSLDEFETAQGNAAKAQLALAREELGLDHVMGHVRNSYYMDYVPLAHPRNLYNLLTSRVLPSLRLELNSTAERLIIINTGSVRYDLYKGPYTVDSHFIVSPFQNDWVKVSLPKQIALQISPKLNENGYILLDMAASYLRPPHQRSAKSPLQVPQGQQVLAYPDLFDEVESSTKLSKGYVTYDDFGHDGDDTPHKAVVNFPLPNVVQSEELDPASGSDALVDVVFYSFLIPNVKWAVGELGYTMPQVELYSAKYLGLLLDEFVASNKV